MKKVLFLLLFLSTLIYSLNPRPGILTVTYSGKTYNTDQIGNHQVDFHAEKLVCGKYFYTFPAGDYLQTKKNDFDEIGYHHPSAEGNDGVFFIWKLEILEVNNTDFYNSRFSET